MPDPLNKGQNLGMFAFEDGMIISSSGRDVFVEIEGKLYSHILDLRTGYPIKDFSTLTIYYPGIEDENFLASAALAVMGRERAFKLLGSMKGTAALWIDGEGKMHPQFNEASKAKWEEDRSSFNRMLGM